MDDQDDPALLRRYAEENSEEAFAELVRRQIGMVFAVALRQVGGDAHLARDVAQTVFTDLARKAASLSGRASLTGWLFTSTHYAAAKAVRSAQRRRKHEGEAHLMNEISRDNSPPPDWERLRPMLDDSIRELPDRDREAVLLRFFEGRDFADVGAKLQLSADGARSRVDRALEKIRHSLARRGVTSTAAAIGLALANQIGGAVPAGLAATITHAVIAGAAGGGATAGILGFMSMSKVTFGIVGALAVAGAVGLYQQHQANTALSAEVAALHQQTQQLETVRAENQRLAKAAEDVAALRAQQSELATLRTEVNALKQRNAELSRAASTAPGAKPVAATTDEKKQLAPGMLPVESWSNVGHATPAAAFQTELWAAMGGDVDLQARSVTFTPEGRAKAEALFASLPESERARYGSPERMGAFFMSSGTPFAGMQVLGQTAQGPDDVTLDTQWQYDDGRVRQNQWQFHRASDGTWQRVIPAGMVDKWVDVLRNGRSAAPSTPRSVPGR